MKKSVPVKLGLLFLPVLLLTGCDRDPYRIGVEPTNSDGVVIHFANCRDYRVFRVALSISGQRDAPLWEAVAVSPEGEQLFEFLVGSQPPGFETTVPLSVELQDTEYLVVIDSTFLQGQSFSYPGSMLRDGYVLAGNRQHYTVEEFKAGALCD